MTQSLKLALLAFIIVVPLGILGGVVAALHAGRPIDRIIIDRRPVRHRGAGVRRRHRPDRWSSACGCDWLPISATLATGHGVARRSSSTCCCRRSRCAGAVRLHRAHGARRHDRGARLRLHAHGHPEGPAPAHGDLAPRAAQRAAADDHRDRHPDRLPDRRSRRHRDAVQLPRHRRADLDRRPQQGLSRMLQAGGAGDRRRLPASRRCRRHRSTPCLNPRIRFGGAAE